MNLSGDSAESVVRIMLQGTETVLKIGGSAGKNVAVALYALSKEQKNSKGKSTLAKMLKSNKECKVFSIKQTELDTFNKQANAYGVMFCALGNKKEKSSDGMIDIMVKAEDASKVNRIITRFNLSTVDKASIKMEAQKEIDEHSKSTEVPKSLGKEKESQSNSSSNSNSKSEKDFKKESVKKKLDNYKVDIQHKIDDKSKLKLKSNKSKGR